MVYAGGSMTSKDLLERHLPHRLSVLRGFLDCPRDERAWNIYNAAKDGAMVTCRSLWHLMGVASASRDEKAPHAPLVPLDATDYPTSKSIGGVAVPQFTLSEVKALPLHDDLRLVLIAGNKCVAHLDEYPDHGVDHDVLTRVIGLTIGELKKRVPNILD
jgi:hypothetical protein